MPEWISVKERLPEIHKSLFNSSDVVLIAHRLRSRPNRLVVRPAVLVQEEQGCFSGGGIWYTVGSSMPIMDVTHWMPLPDPPEREKENASLG